MIKNLEEELEHLENYTNDLHERYDEKKAEIIKLKKQLAIAVEALDLYKNLRGDGTLKNYESLAVKALEQIKELDK